MGINLLQNIALGVVSFFSLTNLFLIGIGTFCGIIIGAMPGLSTTMGIALFVPFTFSLSPIAGLAMLGGLYNGSVYGGSISAILLRTPGTAASCATVFDGYPMTQKGQGAKALGIALVSSFIGGIFSAVILLFLAPPLASFALSFGPPEYFMVAVLGLTIIISLSDDKSLIKGFLAGAFGLLIATVGFDTIEGFPRFTFGNVGLYDGVSLVPALIGLFSFSQALRLCLKPDSRNAVPAKSNLIGNALPSWTELHSIRKTLLRSSIIGTIVGILPGAGADIASFVSYSEAKRKSDRPETFGTGIIEGVAASEASNNAVVGGSLVPLLTLGIPGNSASAVLLGGLLIHGLNPGPMLFTGRPDVVYGFIMSLLVANVIMFVMGLAGLKIFPQVLRVPNKILVPLIIVFSVAGSYAIQNSFMDVSLMLVFGVIGVVLEHFNFPLAPIVLGIILGPIAEDALWQSLIISNGSYAIFFTRPISLVLFVLSVASVLYALFNKYKQQLLRRNA